MRHHDKWYWFKPSNWLHRLRYKFDEAYRIEIGVGLSPIRSNREHKALIKFCENELKDKARMRLNPERSKIYRFTLMLDKQGKSDNPKTYTKIHELQLHKEEPKRHYNDVNTFIEDHVGWYWN